MPEPRDDVQDVLVSREAWKPEATAAAERTGTYLPRVLESATSSCDWTGIRNSYLDYAYMTIVIHAGQVTLQAKLRDTPTAAAIAARLPLASVAQTWGDEVYFVLPLDVDLEADARDAINPGELAFWVEGRCLVTRTNIWADASDDVSVLQRVQAGDKIGIEKS